MLKVNVGGTWEETAWKSLEYNEDDPDGWSAIEVSWLSNYWNGEMRLKLDGVEQAHIIGKDTHNFAIDSVRLGAIDPDSNVSGELYFDDFESRRFSNIGLVDAPDIDLPELADQAGWTERVFAYEGAQPHAVTSVTPETETPDTYQYDENGNMTCRVEEGTAWKQEYNAENRIQSIAKLDDDDCDTGTSIESWTFQYDGDGNRVQTQHTASDQNGDPVFLDSSDYYFGGAYEVRSGGTVMKYYSFGGQMIAVSDGTDLNYLLTDHLGSTVAITDDSGALVAEQRYLPFGQVRSILPNTNLPGTNPPTDFTYRAASRSEAEWTPVNAAWTKAWAV